MMIESKRDRASNGSNGDDGCVMKKQKLSGEDDPKWTNVAAVSSLADAQPDAAPSSMPRIKMEEEDEEEEEEKISDNHIAIISLLASIQNNPICVDFVEGVFGLMKRMVRSMDQHEDLLKHIIDADGITLTATIMKKYPLEKGVHKEGRALLGLLCKTVKAKASKEGIQAVLAVMKILPGDIVLQKKCCGTLAIAANAFREFIGESQGILWIVTALKNHPNEEAISYEGLWALANLTHCSCKSRNHQRVADADGIDLVVETLTRHDPNNIMMVQVGISLLENLASRKELVPPIIQANGHVAVINLMNRHPHNAFVQERGCSALASMAAFDLKGVKQQIADAGAIPALVNVMKSYHNDVEVLKGSCHVLYNLSKGDENKPVQQAIVRAGGLEALGSVIRLYFSSNEKGVVSLAKNAIDNCTPSCS